MAELKNGEAELVATRAEDVCDHNEMIWRIDRWICAKCGYEYGNNNRRRTI